jgi:hypothetical protein
MARPIRGIDICLPLDYNDGRPNLETKYLSLFPREEPSHASRRAAGDLKW